MLEQSLKTKEYDLSSTTFKKLKSGTGFTLIESIIYIGLLSFLLSSLLAITYESLQSTEQIARKIVTQQEANFLMRKIDWALTGASGVSLSGNSLVVSRNGTPTSITFIYDLSTKSLSMTSSDFPQPETPIQLNSSNALVIENSSGSFFTVDNSTKKITVNFKLNGEPFSMTKFLR